MLPSNEVSAVSMTERDRALRGPRRLGVGGLCLLLLLALLPTVAVAEDDHPWIGREAALEQVLRHGDIDSMEEIGTGITNPYRVVVHHEGTTVRGVFKPLDRRQHGEKESWGAEIAAYRLSRALGLDMVPPTVERRIGRRIGSLQLWIENVAPYKDVMEEGAIAESRWPLQIARMRFFDFLIDNPDRNAGNFLIDAAQGHVYLIDHSRAMNFGGRGRNREASPPFFLDRYLSDRLVDLSDGDLEALLGDVLAKRELRGVIRLRDQMLEHVEGVHQSLGAQAFFVAEGQLSENR